MIVLDRLLAVLAIDVMLHHRLTIPDASSVPGRNSEIAAITSSKQVGLSSVRNRRIPEPSIWNTPTVSPRESNLVGIGVVERQPVQVGRLFAAGA